MAWVGMILSFVMGTVGMYLMIRGKKIQQPRMIVWGGVLIVLSYFLFSWGGKDEPAQDTLKNLLPTATEQAQPTPQI